MDGSWMGFPLFLVFSLLLLLIEMCSDLTIDQRNGW